jgi:hypothetical protein
MQWCLYLRGRRHFSSPSAQVPSLHTLTMVFTILPPRPELVIEKRLVFALKIAEGTVSHEVLHGVGLNLGNIAAFLRVLLYSIQVNSDLKEILSNITAGNIRAVVEFVTHFIGSPNVEAEKIVNFHAQRGRPYIIPIHESSKAAILGDYSHYVANTSLAMNVFDTQTSDRKEHFLCLMIVSYFLSGSTVKDRDGFIHTKRIVEEMQKWGFLPPQTESALRRLTNKRLIETTELITFEEDLVGLIGEIPEGFRPTSIGAYHVQRWAANFAYLDAVVFDTPIFDQDTQDRFVEKLGSFDIADRYERALAFRNYLSATWESSGLRPEYFDWNESVREGQKDFAIVLLAIETIARERKRNSAATSPSAR